MDTSGRKSICNWLLILLIALVMSGCAQTQVTNNSGTLLDLVKVGSVNFDENLDYCGDGCSTGFKKVKTGDHKVSLRETPTSSWKAVGTVGPFKKGKFYSVNVRKLLGQIGPGKQYCTELWQRFDTDSEFNNDTTKTRIDSSCQLTMVPVDPSSTPGSDTSPSSDDPPESMVTNSSGGTIFKVKIDDDLEDDVEGIEYTENLSFCSDGCSTGYKPLLSEDNHIMLQKTSGSTWLTLSEQLGPFEYGLFYSVNITEVSDDGFCAELWEIEDPNKTFNEDTVGREPLTSHCN